MRDAQVQLNDLRDRFADSNPDLTREIGDLSRDLSRLSVGQTASPELDARISREVLPKLEALEVQLRRQAGEKPKPHKGAAVQATVSRRASTTLWRNTSAS